MSLLDINPQKDSYWPQIDLIKAFAILSVIVLHATPKPVLAIIGAPFHVAQAVPIFMVLAGLNSTLSMARANVGSPAEAYRWELIRKPLLRILVPFTLIWLLEIALLRVMRTVSLSEILGLYLMGGIGQGSYFTPLFVQHVLFFPALLWLWQRLGGAWTACLVFFLAGVAADWLCVALDISSPFYRRLYSRYAVAAILGAFLVRNHSPALGGLSTGSIELHLHKAVLFMLALLSGLYLIVASYFSWHPHFLYPTWAFEQVPAFFYTVTVVLLLWRAGTRLKIYPQMLLLIGKASYHIFLVQMVYFWNPTLISRHIPDVPLFVAASLLLCTTAGVCFYRFQLVCEIWWRQRRAEQESRGKMAEIKPD